MKKHKLLSNAAKAGILVLAIIFAGCSAEDDEEENQTSQSESPTQAEESSSKTPETSTSVSGEITTYNSTEKIDVSSWTNSYSPAASSRDITSDASDFSSVTWNATVYINLSTLQVSSDNSNWTTLSDGGDAQNLALGETSVSASISDNVLSIDSSDYKSNLKFDITGTAEKGALEISSYKKGTIALYLHDAKITSSGNYPCINVDKKSTVYLYLEGENSLTDGRTYGTGYSEAEGTDYYTSSFSGTKADDAELTRTWAKGSDTKGSVYAKGAILISGTGSLSLTEGYKHGIYSKDYIRIFSGTLSVSTSGRNAIQSVNGFVMDDGNITISGTGTNTNNESRGIIVEGDDDSNDYSGEGFIVIKGGTITSTTVSKAISAKWDIDDDASTTDTSDDPYPYVLISGGNLNLTTTGTPKDESSQAYSVLSADGVTETETTKLSPEGIEGKQAVFISGGILNLNTTDDSINASRDTSGYAGQVVISGGNIYAYSSNNDAIDSNGTLTISGGIVVALTSTTPECAFDCDQNTFSVTGGLLCGIGTNNYSSPTSSACTQSTIVLSGNYFGAGGTTFALEDSSSSPVFAFEIPSSFGTSANSNYIMIFSSPNIQAGTTYKAVSGVTASGGKTFRNLYVELPSVSGGTSTLTSVSTSTSNYVYTAASSTNGGAQEGNHPNAGPGNQGGQGGRR